MAPLQSFVHAAYAEAERTVKTGSINFGAAVSLDARHLSHKALDCWPPVTGEVDVTNAEHDSTIGQEGESRECGADQPHLQSER